MPLPAFITKIFSGGAGEIIGKVGGIIDNLTISKEEKEQFKAALLQETNRHLEALGAMAQAETDSYLKDVDSARQMQIAALAQSDSFSKRFVYYLAAGLIVLTFAFDMMFFFIQYPERNHDIINMTAGVLNSVGFSAVVSFFFGSSKGSEDKSKQIAQMNEASK